METTTLQTPDGVSIHTVHWSPENESDRVVMLVHGISEHSGRYAHVADHLTGEGYHVYAHDHRGHGKSTGDRVHAPSNTAYIADLKLFYDRVARTHPSANIYMIGHSMGSVISLQFVHTYPDAITALVVTGTATDVVSTVPPALRSVANALYRIYSQAPISAPGGSAVLTRDADMLKAADADPLFYHGWTKTSTAKYIVEIGEMLQDKASEITLPVMFMHGADDELTPVSGSRIMHERVGSADKTLKIYDNMLHEIMNEVDRATVLADISTWLNAH